MRSAFSPDKKKILNISLDAYLHKLTNLSLFLVEAIATFHATLVGNAGLEYKISVHKMIMEGLNLNISSIISTDMAEQLKSLLLNHVILDSVLLHNALGRCFLPLFWTNQAFDSQKLVEEARCVCVCVPLS